jgi:hypothetical protein
MASASMQSRLNAPGLLARQGSWLSAGRATVQPSDEAVVSRPTLVGGGVEALRRSIPALPGGAAPAAESGASAIARGGPPGASSNLLTTRLSEAPPINYAAVAPELSALQTANALGNHAADAALLARASMQSSVGSAVGFTSASLFSLPVQEAWMSPQAPQGVLANAAVNSVSAAAQGPYATGPAESPSTYAVQGFAATGRAMPAGVGPLGVAVDVGQVPSAAGSAQNQGCLADCSCGGCQSGAVGPGADPINIPSGGLGTGSKWNGGLSVPAHEDLVGFEASRDAAWSVGLSRSARLGNSLPGDGRRSGLSASPPDLAPRGGSGLGQPTRGDWGARGLAARWRCSQDEGPRPGEVVAFSPLAAFRDLGVSLPALRGDRIESSLRSGDAGLLPHSRTLGFPAAGLSQIDQQALRDRRGLEADLRRRGRGGFATPPMGAAAHGLAALSRSQLRAMDLLGRGSVGLEVGLRTATDTLRSVRGIGKKRGIGQAKLPRIGLPTLRICNCEPYPFSPTGGTGKSPPRGDAGDREVSARPGGHRAPTSASGALVGARASYDPHRPELSARKSRAILAQMERELGSGLVSEAEFLREAWAGVGVVAGTPDTGPAQGCGCPAAGDAERAEVGRVARASAGQPACPGARDGRVACLTDWSARIAGSGLANIIPSSIAERGLEASAGKIAAGGPGLVVGAPAGRKHLRFCSQLGNARSGLGVAIGIAMRPSAQRGLERLAPHALPPGSELGLSGPQGLGSHAHRGLQSTDIDTWRVEVEPVAADRFAGGLSPPAHAAKRGLQVRSRGAFFKGLVGKPVLPSPWPQLTPGPPWSLLLQAEHSGFPLRGHAIRRGERLLGARPAVVPGLEWQPQEPASFSDHLTRWSRARGAKTGLGAPRAAWSLGLARVTPSAASVHTSSAWALDLADAGVGSTQYASVGGAPGHLAQVDPTDLKAPSARGQSSKTKRAGDLSPSNRAAPPHGLAWRGGSVERGGNPFSTNNRSRIAASPTGSGGFAIWNDGFIPYAFVNTTFGDKWSGAGPVQSIVQAAITRWNTQVFIPMGKPGFTHVYEGDSVHLYYEAEKNGGASNPDYDYFWKSGYFGSVNFGANTSMAVALHELGHVLGLKHEQKRPDRDLYIVLAEATGDTDQVEAEGSIHPLGPYNGGSIMQYRSGIDGASNWVMLCQKAWQYSLGADAAIATSFGQQIARKFPHDVFCPGGTEGGLFMSQTLTALDISGAIELYQASTSFGGLGWRVFSPAMPENLMILEGKGVDSPCVSTVGDLIYFASAVGADGITLESDTTTDRIWGSPALTSMGDGGIHVFVATTEGDKIAYRSANKNGAWSEWVFVNAPFETRIFAPPAVVSRKPGTLDLVVASEYGNVFHRQYTQELGWGNWVWVQGARAYCKFDAGDYLSARIRHEWARPAIASASPDSVHIFVATGVMVPNGDLSLLKSTKITYAPGDAPTYSKWQPLNLQPIDGSSTLYPASAPAAVSYEAGSIGVSVVGSDGQVWFTQLVGAGNAGEFLQAAIAPAWVPLGKPAAGLLRGSGVAIHCWAPGYVNIFARSPQGHLYQRAAINLVWQPSWWNLGGILATDPGVATHSTVVMALMGGARENPTAFGGIPPLGPGISSPNIYVLDNWDISLIRSIEMGLWYKSVEPVFEVEGGGL